jgi:uncharacterized protein
MSNERLFLDTVFIQASLNEDDQYHEQAKKVVSRVRQAKEIWTTEAVLMEVANALSSFKRLETANLIERYYKTQNMRIVSVDNILFLRGLSLYKSRIDKSWGLIDCISFTVMQQQNLIIAATADQHFIQAGFRALLLE